MGNVNEPYMASNRFEVAFTSTPPRFRLELTIVGRHSRFLTYLFIWPMVGDALIRGELWATSSQSSAVILCRQTRPVSRNNFERRCRCL